MSFCSRGMALAAIASGCLFVLGTLLSTGHHRQWEFALRSLLENENFKPQFAGHETFTLRYGWLKEAIDAVIAANIAERGSANSIFTSEQCIAEFGVGKNMVHSMRHWGLATGVLFHDEAQKLDVSPLGCAIFGEAGDPYLEHPASLWLLHWQLTAFPGRATTWYWAYNELNEPSFDRDLLVKRLSRRLADLREFGAKICDFPKRRSAAMLNVSFVLIWRNQSAPRGCMKKISNRR